MATSVCWRAWKVLQLRHTVLKLNHDRAAVSGCMLQQVRWKGEGKTKIPNTGKEKEKWVPREMKKAKSVVPNNWDKFLRRVPEDDVWIRMHYPRPRYTISKTIEMHREYAHPEMTDNMEGMVYMDVEIDCRTKKKTKFIGKMSQTILLPHRIEGIEGRVIAFCKTQEDKEIADEAGAVYSGGVDLIKAIEKGDITAEDFDHVVTTIDILPELAKIRKHLKDHFPHKNKGNLGVDIAALVNHFRFGETYESTKEDDAVAKIKVKLGQLNTPEEHLEANFNTYINSFWIHNKNRTPSLGPFVTSAMITCPPSHEKLMIVAEQLLPESEKKLNKAQKEENEEEEEEEASIR